MRSICAVRRLAPTVLERARHHLLVGIEAGVDRVDRHQRRQHRRARARGDQVADGDLELADAARDRRAHLRYSRGSAAPTAARPRAARRLASASRCALIALVEVALRRCALSSHRALGALVLAVREATARLRGRDLRLRAIDFGRVGRRIDRDQQVARVDQRAFAEMHRLNGAGDARADVDALDRFEAAGEFVPEWRPRAARPRRPRPASPWRRGDRCSLEGGAGARVRRDRNAPRLPRVAAATPACPIAGCGSIGLCIA